MSLLFENTFTFTHSAHQQLVDLCMVPYPSVACSTEFNNLVCCCWQADEREQKARDYMRAEVNPVVWTVVTKSIAWNVCTCICKLSVSLLPQVTDSVLITGRISHFDLLCHAALFQLRYQRALEDLKTKNLNIQDSAKKYSEMQHR